MSKYTLKDYIRNEYASPHWVTATEEAHRYARFDTMIDQVKTDAKQEGLEEGWDEGYSAAKLNARMWGHIDHWEGDDTNPYREQEEA